MYSLRLAFTIRYCFVQRSVIESFYLSGVILRPLSFVDKKMTPRLTAPSQREVYLNQIRWCSAIFSLSVAFLLRAYSSSIGLWPCLYHATFNMIANCFSIYWSICSCARKLHSKWDCMPISESTSLEVFRKKLEIILKAILVGRRL